MSTTGRALKVAAGAPPTKPVESMAQVTVPPLTVMREESPPGAVVVVPLPRPMPSVSLQTKAPPSI